MTDETRPSHDMPSRIGKYRVLQRIGKGAMGVVYAARDDMMDRTVAVKLMMTDLEAEPQARARFYREARVAGQLLHRNIVTVFDLGEDEGRPYIVMELLKGATLAEYMKQPEGRFLETRLGLLIQLCEGLSAAHAKAIIHRDIKPGNLFVQTDGVLKILDFGIARLPTSTITVDGFVMGTPDYMSPEQSRGREVDHRSDIFSAAAVSYYVLSGRRPFAAGDLQGTLRKLTGEEPPPLTEDEAPEALARIVFHGLAKDPGRRYQRASEMLTDLERFRRHCDAETARQVDDAMVVAGEVRELLQAHGAMSVRLGLPVPPPGTAEALAALPGQFQAAVDSEAATVVLAPLRRAEVADVLRTLGPHRATLKAEIGPLRAAVDALEEGERLFAAGDIEHALARLQAGARSAPASAAIQQAIGRCHQVQAERQARAQEIESRLAASREAASAADWQEAARLCDEVLALDATQTEAVNRRAEAQVALERQAVRRAEQLRERLDRAREALAKGAFDSATAHLEDARAVDPGAEAIGLLAREIEAARARAAAAAELLRRARAAMTSARDAFAGGRRSEALGVLQAFLASVPAEGAEALAPQVAEVGRELARLTEEAARAAEAERRRAEIAKHLEAARAAWAADDPEGTLAAVEQVLAIDPADETACRLRDQAKLKHWELQDQEARASESRAHVARGHACLADGRHSDAVQAAEQALVLDPSSEEARALLLDALRLEGERRAAARRSPFEREQAASSPRRAAARPAHPVTDAGDAHVAVRASVPPGDQVAGPPPAAEAPLPAALLQAVAGGLRALQDGLGLKREAPVARSTGTGSDAAAAAPTVVTVTTRRGGRMRWLGLAAAVVLIVGTVVLSVVLRRPASEPSQPSPAPEVVQQLEGRAFGSFAALAEGPETLRWPDVEAESAPVTPVPAVPLLPRLPGETDAALYARSQEIHDRYERAREMLSGGEYQKAVILLSAIVKQQPQYEQAAGLLGEARQGVRKLASQAATAGERLEQAGDQPGALREYERAQQIDPSWREAEDTVRRLRSAMTAEGSELYSRARQLDAVGLKTDAIALYERALKLLPPDDERSRQATERLRVLKGRLEAPSPGVSSTTGPRRNGSLISRAR